jgi:hypothetical protein
VVSNVGTSRVAVGAGGASGAGGGDASESGEGAASGAGGGDDSGAGGGDDSGADGGEASGEGGGEASAAGGLGAGGDVGSARTSISEVGDELGGMPVASEIYSSGSVASAWAVVPESMVLISADGAV